MLTEGIIRRERLSEGLVLRCVESRRDVERLAEFNASVHEEEVGGFTRRLLLEHPRSDPRYWLIAEHDKDGIVSSLCLIPWRVELEAMELSSGEMGIVGTAPAWRKRGLVRRLVERFDSLLGTDGFDLTHIQGIPYFYRQFGYEYAVPLIPDLRLDPAAIPAPSRTASSHGELTMRPASIDDAKALCGLAAEVAADLELRAVRDEAIWRYVCSGTTSGYGETWCLCSGGAVRGYVRTHRQGFGPGLIVSETSRLDEAQTGWVLHELAGMCRERNKPYVKIETHPASALAAAARRLGATDHGHYAWQFRIVDPVALLEKLAPVLERRVERSDYREMSRVVGIDWYRGSVALVFREGRIAEASSPAPADAPRFRLPPFLLVPLVLGYREIHELRSGYHDVSVPHELREVAAVLFPPLKGWLATIY